MLSSHGVVLAWVVKKRELARLGIGASKQSVAEDADGERCCMRSRARVEMRERRSISRATRKLIRDRDLRARGLGEHK